MNEDPFAQEQKLQQHQGGRLLNRLEAMERLRLKSAHFSKVVAGKIKGLPLLACVRIGRRQLFPAGHARPLDCRSRGDIIMQKGSLKVVKDRRGVKVWRLQWRENGRGRTRILGCCADLSRAQADAERKKILGPLNTNEEAAAGRAVTLRRYVEDEYLTVKEPRLEALHACHHGPNHREPYSQGTRAAAARPDHAKRAASASRCEG